MFENERFMPMRGWAAANLLPTDRRRFSGPSSQTSSDFPVVNAGRGVLPPLPADLCLLIIHCCLGNTASVSHVVPLMLQQAAGKMCMVWPDAPRHRQQLLWDAHETESDNSLRCPTGWQWEGAWEVESAGNVDKDGWAYALNFPLLQYPPPVVPCRPCSRPDQPDLTSLTSVLSLASARAKWHNTLDVFLPLFLRSRAPHQHLVSASNWFNACAPAAAQRCKRKGLTDCVRRRRWVRTKRQDTSAAPSRASSGQVSEPGSARSEPAGRTTVLGVVAPGGKLPLPYEWNTLGNQLQVWILLKHRLQQRQRWLRLVSQFPCALCTS